ncbi:hypothetical protein [Gluconacetobacter tumulicola]|uniref:Uncharacterized protein n=1 Tax=Gluconacetobacter tumulicola TaxID=1017177 RepID=A0A7W4JBU5_9PROT|nr:hypothetical protein [Gluconacetobacter tumulicola]MBB2178375.1 hypothetical protein [Gluconacetobacter tumulicola]
MAQDEQDDAMPYPSSFAPVDGLDLARRIMMGLFFTECLALMTPVIVLSWHDHRPDDAFPRLSDMKKPFNEPVR